VETRGGAADEIRRMQGGIRDWVARAAHAGALRKVSPPVLLSLLCASAFCPLLAVGAGAMAAAGIGVLSSVGGGVLASVLTSAIDRLRPGSEAPAPSREDIENSVARQIQQTLEAGDERAAALRSEIAAVLTQVGVGQVMLQAAIETGSERVHADVIAVIEMLGNGFAELGFLIGNVARAAARLQERLDEQSADVRGVIDQNYRQSTQIRLIREQLTAIELRAGVGVANGGRRALWAGRCPYRGLVPFESDDEGVFYGRERLTTELAVTLARQVTRGGLTVVTGASGAGKSSLLRAGLLPALARGVQVAGSEKWPCRVITPTRDPLMELAAALAVIGGTDMVMVRDSLTAHPDQAYLAFRQAVDADVARRHGWLQSARDAARLVLVVDQFEQLFTLSPGPDGEPARQAFITALCTAATTATGSSGQPPALVVIAVRGDFWDRCAAYPELARELQDGQFVVGPMTEPELRLAITGPAEAAGLSIDDALTETIIFDLDAAGGDDTAGALPLLSQAMLMTWENREGDRLTSHGYGLAGGVSRAVQTSADAVYDSLPAAQQTLARQILRTMTIVGRDGRFTRRPVPRTDLYATSPDTDRSQVDEILEAFAARRLVVLDTSTAQIAHDALLRAWPRLRAWLAEDQATWVLYGQLADDAAEWQASKRDPSFLYRGTQLASVRQAADRWSGNSSRYPALTAIQQAFLQASIRAAKRAIRQRRTLSGILVLLLIASLVGATIATQKARTANTAALAAVSGQLAIQSEAVDAADPFQAAELAAASWRLAPTARARALARVSLLDVLAEPDRGVLAIPGDSVSAVAFSPDGKMLATVGYHGRIRLWDVATRRQIGAPMSADGYYLSAVAFSPDGKTLATASYDGTARLWDVATHRQIGAPMTADSRFVNAVAFSPDGKTLATASDDGTARLWDVATHRQIGAPITPNSSFVVAAVAFSPDGKTLATGSWDGTARLWDAATHRQIGAPMTVGKNAVLAVAFSPDGKTLATAVENKASAWLWDVATQQQVETLSFSNTAVLAVAFSPDGKTLATGSANYSGAGIAQLWDIGTQLQIGAPMTADSSFVVAVAFSPDGKILATASQDGTARLWDAATQQQVGAPMTADRKYVNAVAFSPDGKTLATGGCDGTARLWNVSTQRQIGAPMTADSYCVDDLVFSPDGKILATGGSSGSVRLWDVATHREIGTPIVRDTSVNGVAFSPDGKTLATAGSDGTARLWNVSTQRQIGAPMTADGYYMKAVAFSPDGATLATASYDGTARLWDVATQQQIGAPMTADSRYVKWVAFSPDGTTLATTSDDGTARLWDVATQQQIGAPMTAAGGDFLAWVAFSPDGATLATGGDDGTARLWDVAFPRDLVGAVCAIAGNSSLTRAQWAADVPSEPFEQTCP
jgi:WD40 repeat protein